MNSQWPGKNANTCCKMPASLRGLDVAANACFCVRVETMCSQLLLCVVLSEAKRDLSSLKISLPGLIVWFD
jgi:hypothetical protein